MEENNEIQIHAKIISYLKNQGAIHAETAIRTQNISLKIFGKSQRKYSNPYLYELQKKGKITRCTNDKGSKPKWYLTSNDEEGVWF